MIEQYLQQTNESATIPKIQNFCQLNKAQVSAITIGAATALQALFGCSRIRINPYVLGWIGVELELNFTPIHSNTCGLK